MSVESMAAVATSCLRIESLRSKTIRERLGFPDIEHLPVGVVLLNRHFELERFNPHYARYIEAYSPCTPNDAVGCSYFSVVPGSHRLVGDWLRTVRDRKTAISLVGSPLPVHTESGTKMTYWDAGMVPILDRSGKFNGMIMVSCEVTGRVESETSRRPQENEEDHIFSALNRILPFIGNEREKGRPSVAESEGLSIETVEENHHPPVQPHLRLARSFALTPREIQVACLLVKGKTNKEMADRLCVSSACIEFHRNNIRGKIGLKHTGTNLSTFLMAHMDI